MGRRFILHYDEIPPCDCIHCRSCRTRVAFVHDYIPDVTNLVSGGFINNMFNVEIPEDDRYHRVEGGGTLAETYCVECRNLLGWKLIAFPQPSRYYREGRFYIKLNKLIYWNDVTLFDYLSGGDNEQAPNDQDGDTDEELDHEENADQDGDANEQYLGANEQNADQDGYANEQNGYQYGGANEQVPNQDVDITEGMGNIDLNGNI